MKKTIILTCSFLLFITPLITAQTDSVLVSNVKFKNLKYDNPHAGSGFLLKYKNKIYGCTAKHVLFFAKTDNMRTISFGNDLKSWNFQSKINPDRKVLAGRLINENISE